MTAITGLLLVASTQRKSRDAVVELSLRPASWAMALAARSILEGVPVGTLGLMTTTAFGVDGLVASIRVTLCTLNAPVLSNQGELTH